MTKKIVKNKKEQPLFYVAMTIYPFLDGKHKSIIRNMIKSMNCSYWEAPNGEKVLFALCKKKDKEGKEEIICPCGCKKEFGTTETLTEKEIEQKFPMFYYQKIKACWKCQGNGIDSKKTFWDKDKDKLITFWICEPCGKNDEKIDSEIVEENKKEGFIFEPVKCNQCEKGIWTDWKSRERVEMYKNKELIYCCYDCLVKGGNQEFIKSIPVESQGSWITLGETSVIKYNQIKEKEYQELQNYGNYK